MVQPDAPVTDAPADQQPAEQPAQQPQAPARQEPQPDGAYARFSTSDGTADAWLRTDEGDDPVGYVRENSEDPPRTVRYTNPAHWAEDVDGRGMQQVGGDPAAPEQGQEQAVSEVTDALQGLASGERTLDDVAEFFQNREWPGQSTTDNPTTSSEGEPSGSFAEVVDAYSNQLINHDQYVRLAQAATEAMRAQSGTGEQT